MSHCGQSCCCNSSNGCCCDQSSCGCNCACCSPKNQCCDQGSCSQNNSCDKAEKLLHVADMAWMEVLKEKIKQHIIQNDPKIDELAKIVAETNHDRWKQKMSNHKNGMTYEEKIKKLYDCCDSHCQTGKK